MFWLAVRADGMGSDGVAVGCGVGPELAEGVADAAPPGPDAVLPGVAEADPAAPDGLTDGLPEAVTANSDWLAGTSSRNDWKIWLSSGCVHSTLAVSVGTASDRG